ncbi:MAG: alkaline shock response membrane anchor protein AmaP [Atopobiaceae bacterium]|nr:alkaline shock response membrane anchor protein AmaP [Atopobiaceae bacterium]MBR1829018.1 alkaline shock response membrane anchor protein AmaP [Atopobiaceae bacterium]
MNAFKRICLFLFGVSGIVALVTLALPWFGPWTRGATTLMTVNWYVTMVQVALGITALGVLVSLGRAIFTPRKSKTVVVTKQSGDEVTVTTAAISSQAAHIVEEDHDFFAERVTVVAKRRGHVRVFVRVRPAHAINVTEEGARLHARLEEGLSALCGKSIDRIVLEFVEPDSLDPKPEYLDVSESPSVEAGSYVGAATYETLAPSSSSPDYPTEITVPMASPVEAPSPEEG